MRRAAEPVNTQPAALGQIGPSQRAVADDPRAEKGRRFPVRERVGQRVGVRLVDDRVLGVAAVDVPAGEARREAEVLASGGAEATRAARVRKPWHADAVTQSPPQRARSELVDDADDLVARRDAGAVHRQVTLGHVEVGAADAADTHAQPDLARRRFGDFLVDPHQRAAVDRAGSFDLPRQHRGGAHVVQRTGAAR